MALPARLALYCVALLSLFSLAEADSSMASRMASTYRRAVFSDVDGTLVHYPSHLQTGGANDEGAEGDDGLLYLPPSKTGTRGVISARTLKLCSQLGKGGAKDDGAEGKETSQRRVPFVLVSGMRTTTLFQRLPYLPRADAYVSESGGRIFYPRPISEDGTVGVEGAVEGVAVQPKSYPGISPADAAPFALVEDLHWRHRMSQPNAAGNDGYNDEVPIDERKGKLWEFARSLTDRGNTLDTTGYATAFRVNRKHQRGDLASRFDEFLEECASTVGIPDELGCSTNLGCVDVYPKMSGKRNCAEYLVKRLLQIQEEGDEPLISLKRHAYFLCDDDNDVELALACRTAYLPSVTSESIRKLVGSDAGNLVVTEDTSRGIVETLATEAALEKIIQELRQNMA